jgi:hypothetical protein
MMFHFSDDELWSLLSLDQMDRWSDCFRLVDRARSLYKPLFFTPYQDLKSLGAELAAPITVPLRLLGMASAATIGAGLALIACIGAGLIAGIAALFRCSHAADEVFNAACKASIVLGSALITTASCLLLALISIPYGLASIITRSTVTTAAVFANTPDQDMPLASPC